MENEKVCKRCKQSYMPSSNNSSSCRFHPSFFVCRRHDDQKSKALHNCNFCHLELVNCNREGAERHTHCSVCKGYYELSPNDPPYAAKFYDCCGAEDPAASGCTTGFHASYDDDY